MNSVCAKGAIKNRQSRCTGHTRHNTQETKNTNPEKNNILKKFLVIVNNRFDFLPPTHKKERIHKKNMGGTILG